MTLVVVECGRAGVVCGDSGERPTRRESCGQRKTELLRAGEKVNGVTKTDADGNILTSGY